jgi:hypothetical protein
MNVTVTLIGPYKYTVKTLLAKSMIQSISIQHYPKLPTAVLTQHKIFIPKQTQHLQKFKIHCTLYILRSIAIRRKGQYSGRSQYWSF